MYLWAVEEYAFLIGAMGEKPGDGIQRRFEQVESPLQGRYPVSYYKEDSEKLCIAKETQRPSPPIPPCLGL